jgi:hypothetical protein
VRDLAKQCSSDLKQRASQELPLLPFSRWAHRQTAPPADCVHQRPQPQTRTLHGLLTPAELLVHQPAGALQYVEQQIASSILTRLLICTGGGGRPTLRTPAWFVLF